MRHLQRYLLAGILTVIPIWFTWIVFDFFFTQLSNVGRPLAQALSDATRKAAPQVADWLLQPWFQSILAITLTILALYLLGWATSRVIGKRLMNLLDLMMNRIPIVQSIYGSVRKLVNVMQSKPENLQRVVLIGFPTPEMKTVGFVTRVFTDSVNGEKLAAVYVPTTPNPTSGYMEIVPLDTLITTDWSMDEAMTFVLSAGAVAPDRITCQPSN
jgi:uncharacterized membrane protein